jgi:hypothetical protein
MDAVGVTCHKYESAKMKTVDQGLIKETNAILRSSTSTLDEAKDHLKRQEATLSEQLAAQKPPESTATESRISQLRTLSSRIQRWGDIKKILGKPAVVSARIYYKVAKQDHSIDVDLVDFKNGGLTASK